MSPIVIDGSAILVVGGAIAIDSSLCCDDLCPVPVCLWAPGYYAPLQSSYSLSFGVWLAAGSPDGACEGNQNAPVTGEWVCEDTVSLTFTPTGTRCRYEDATGNKELCAGADDLDGNPLGSNAIYVYSGSYLKYLNATDEWEIGISIEAVGSTWTLTATADADEIHGPPDSGWSFEINWGGTFSEGDCESVLTDATPQYNEIIISNWSI